MAQRDLQIRITVNSAQAKSAIDALVAQMNNVQGAQARMTQATNTASSAQQKLNKGTADYLSAGAKSANVLGRLENKLRQLDGTNRRLHDGHVRVREQMLAAEKAATAQMRATNQLNASLERNHRAIKNIRLDHLNRQMSEFQSATDRARRTAYSMTIAGGQMAFMAKRIEQNMKAMIDQWVDFDFKLRRAGTAMEVYGSKNMKMLQGSIEDLSIETKLFDPTEVAEGLYFWGSATGEVVKTQEDLLRIQSQVLPIMKAAAMTEVGLETATKGVVSIMQQFNLEFGMAEKVTQDFFYITQKTAVEFTDLIGTFKMMGPSAAQFGVAYEDMVKLAGAIGNAGIRGTQMGRALRMVFTRMVKPPAQAKKAIDRLSEAIYDVPWDELTFPDGNFGGWDNYLEKLYGIYKNLSEFEGAKLINQLFPRATAPVMIQIMENMRISLRDTGKALGENTDMMGDLTQSSIYFNNAWKEISESAKAVLNQFSNRLAPLIHDMGEAFVDIIEPFLDLIGKFAVWVSDLMRANPWIAKVIAGVTALGAAFLALGSIVLLTSGFMFLLGKAVIPNLLMNLVKSQFAAQAMSKSIFSLRASGEVAKGSMNALAESLAAVKKAYAAGGISNVLAGATAGRVGKGAAGSASKAIGGEQMVLFPSGGMKTASIMKTVGNMWRFITKNALGFLRIGGKVAVIGTVIVAVFETITKAIDKAAGGVGSFDGGIGLISSGLNMLKAPLDWAIAGFNGFMTVLGWVSDILSGPLSFAIVGVGRMLELLGEVADNVATWIQDKFGGVIDILSKAAGLLGTLTNTVSDAWDGMWEEGIKWVKGSEKYYADVEAANQRAEEAAEKAARAAEANALLADEMDMMDPDALAAEAEAAAAAVETVLIRSNGQIGSAAERGIRDPIRQAIKDINAGQYAQDEIDKMSTIVSQMGGHEYHINPSGTYQTDVQGTSDILAQQLDMAWGLAVDKTSFEMPAGMVDLSQVKLDISQYNLEIADGLEQMNRDIFEQQQTLTNNFIKKLGVGGKKMGASMMANMLAGIKEGTTNLPAMFSSGINAALKMMRSKDKAVRKEGYRLAGWLTNGWRDGELNVWQPAIQTLIGRSIKAINSSNKAHRQAGRNQMLALARGIVDEGPEVWGMDYYIAKNAIIALQGANSAHWAVGATYMEQIANGMVDRQQVLYDTALKIANNVAAIWNSVATYINGILGTDFMTDKTGEGALADAGITSPAAQKKINAKYKPGPVSSAPRVGGSGSAEAPSGSGGGGGGGGGTGGGGKGKGTGDEQSPLERALEVAENAANLVAALRAVEGYNVKNMVKQSMGKLAQAMKLAMKITAKETKGFSKKQLQKVANFSESIGALADAMSSSIEAFKALPDFRPPKKNKMKQVVEAASVLFKIMSNAGKNIKTKRHVVAREFAETVGAVVEAFGATIGAFGDWDGDWKRVKSATIEAMAADMLKAVTALAKYGKKIKQASLDSASSYAEAVVPVMDAIGATIEAFKGIEEYVSPLPSLMDQIMYDLNDAMNRFVRAARQFGLTAEEWSVINEFATTVSAVMEALTATWEAHNKTVEFVDQFRLMIDPAVLFSQISNAMAQMRVLAAQFTNTEIEKIKNTAEAASAIADAIQGFYDIGRNASNDPDTLGRMVMDAINAIMVTMNNFVAQYYGYGFDIVANFSRGIADGLATFSASPTGTVITQDVNTIVIEHIITDPDGALQNASAAEVANLLSGQEFITNLQSAAKV